MDYTCSKDSNSILFVNFRVTDQKIWILQDLNKIWFLNSILISIWFGDRHVAWSDRAIPVRVDRQWGASDFKRIGRPRSTDTPSLKWFNLNHKIQIGWSKTEERGAHWIRLGFGRRWWAPALDVDDDDAPVVQIDEGDADDVRRRTASSYAWSASTTASWRSSEVQLEWFRASECFGQRWWHRCAALENKRMVSGGATGQEMKHGVRERAWGGPCSPE
jgi:hypothetical protein